MEAARSTRGRYGDEGERSCPGSCCGRTCSTGTSVTCITPSRTHRTAALPPAATLPSFSLSSAATLRIVRKIFRRRAEGPSPRERGEGAAQRRMRGAILQVFRVAPLTLSRARLPLLDLFPRARRGEVE